MNPLTHALNVALVQFVWQGAAVAASLHVVLSLIDARSTRLRYAACATAMLALVMLPVVTAIAAYHIVATNAAAWIASPLSEVTLTTGLERWAIPLWLAAMAGSIVRAARGWWQVSRLRRSAVQISGVASTTLAKIELRLGIRRHVRVALSHLADTPVMFGYWRPMVVLPMSTIAELTQRQLEALLAHELAHVRRHDYLVNIAQVVIETVFAYHPATWWISARMREEREACCDDLAVAVTSDNVGYARTLLTLAQARASQRELMLGISGRDGELTRRIRRLLGQPFQTSPVPGIAALLVAATILACVDAPSVPLRKPMRAARESIVLPEHSARASAVSETVDSAIADTRGVRLAADVIGRRLQSIQITDVSRADRDKIMLPIEIGAFIRADTQREIGIALARTGLPLHAEVFAVPGGAAIVIAVSRKGI